MFYMSMFCIIWDILYIINKCQHFKHTRNSSNSTILINWFLKTFFKCLSLFCELSLEDHIVKNQISFVYLFLLIIQSTSKEKTIYFISRTKRFTKYVQGRPAVTRWPVEPKQIPYQKWPRVRTRTWSESCAHGWTCDPEHKSENAHR